MTVGERSWKAIWQDLERFMTPALRQTAILTPGADPGGNLAQIFTRVWLRTFIAAVSVKTKWWEWHTHPSPADHSMVHTHMDATGWSLWAGTPASKCTWEPDQHSSNKARHSGVLTAPNPWELTSVTGRRWWATHSSSMTPPRPLPEERRVGEEPPPPGSLPEWDGTPWVHDAQWDII